MNTIYEVIRSIAIYLILVTVLLNLVNGNSYKKYVELVCGMVLIVILLAPITRVLSLDDDFLYNFNLSSFKVEVMDTDILADVEEKQQNRIEEEYKKVLMERIAAVVEQEERKVKRAEVILSEEDYGMIEEVTVEVAKNEDKEIQEEGSSDKREEEKIIPVERVEIPKIQLSEEMEEVKEAAEEIKEKNKTTEAIRKTLASEFAIKEEQIIVYEKGE